MNNTNWHDLGELIRKTKEAVSSHKAEKHFWATTNPEEELLLMTQTKYDTFIFHHCNPVFKRSDEVIASSNILPNVMGCRITLLGAKSFIPVFDLTITDKRTKGLRESSFLKNEYPKYIKRAREAMIPYMAYIVRHWAKWANETYPAFSASYPTMLGFPVHFGPTWEITPSLLQTLKSLSETYPGFSVETPSASTQNVSNKEMPTTRLGFITGAWYNGKEQKSKTSISVSLGGGKSVVFDNIDNNVEALLYRHCEVIDRKDGTFGFGNLLTLVNERMMCAVIQKRNENINPAWTFGTMH